MEHKKFSTYIATPHSLKAIQIRFLNAMKMFELLHLSTRNMQKKTIKLSLIQWVHAITLEAYQEEKKSLNIYNIKMCN